MGKAIAFTVVLVAVFGGAWAYSSWTLTNRLADFEKHARSSALAPAKGVQNYPDSALVRSRLKEVAEEHGVTVAGVRIKHTPIDASNVHQADGHARMVAEQLSGLKVREFNAGTGDGIDVNPTVGTRDAGISGMHIEVRGVMSAKMFIWTQQRDMHLEKTVGVQMR